MLRVMLALLVLSASVPLAACGEQPVKQPILTEPGKMKTCPRGQATC